MTGRRGARPDRADSGTVSVLVLGLVVLTVALVVVVTNASRVFLHDRALAAAADGAAAAAARAVEPPEARAAAGPPRTAPISPERARVEVGRYAAVAGLDARFGPGFGYEVDVVGEAVTVTLRARVPLTLVGSLGPAGAVPVRAEATARSVLLPAGPRTVTPRGPVRLSRSAQGARHDVVLG